MDRLVLMLLFIGAAGVLLFVIIRSDRERPPSLPSVSEGLRTFASCQELAAAVEKSSSFGGYGVAERALGVPTAPVGLGAADLSESFSTTNIQVAGVDEADIVKTDGKYLYALSPTRQTLTIVEAVPANDARVLSRTTLTVTPAELFLEGDTVIVFGATQQTEPIPLEGQKSIYPRPVGSLTVAQLWDVKNPSKPETIRQFEVEGSYLTARKIGSSVYFIANAFPAYAVAEERVKEETILPLYRSVQEIHDTTTAFRPIIGCDAVAYSPNILPQSFVTILGFDVARPDREPDKETFFATGDNVYASQEHLYVAGTQYSGGFWLTDLVAPTESVEATVVNVFALDNGAVTHEGALEAPGHTLNQFSMDEYENHFRIATTKGQVSRQGGGAVSNVYVFNASRERVGALEGLAPGEQIYSARFMGKRLYLVTFQKVDPLFAIDVSDPQNPRILGKLKIPGYSDYLHPYDENHIIGLGKEAVAAEEGNFAWYQGLKLALFDVSDVANPKQLHNTIIGDRGSDSYALHDHKAFLFDRAKNLLVIPVLLAEIPEEQKVGSVSNTYGDFTFQGAYVYNLTLNGGFKLNGRVTHLTDDAFTKTGYYYYDDGNAVKRSLYIGDDLYALSENTLTINALADLAERKRIALCTENCSPVFSIEEIP